MQAWIYNPLQRIASDSGMYGGREGKKRTGVGGKLSETKRARIARRPPNRVSCEGRSEESLELSKLCLHLILQNQPG